MKWKKTVQQTHRPFRHVSQLHHQSAQRVDADVVGGDEREREQISAAPGRHVAAVPPIHRDTQELQQAGVHNERLKEGEGPANWDVPADRRWKRGWLIPVMSSAQWVLQKR